MLKLFILNTLSFALSTSIIGDKVTLTKAKSYHFSDSELIRVHSESNPPFFIGLKKGLIDYEIDSKKHRHLILSEKQNIFFKKANHLVSESLLNWSMKDEALLVTGNATSNILYDYLLNECKKNSSNVVLKIKVPRPSLEAHPCLGHLNLKPKVQVHLMLVNHTRIKNSSLGLGAPPSSPWILSSEGQLKLGEISGEIKASTGKGANTGEMIFEGLLSVDHPLHFTNGLEIGIENPGANIFARGNIQWKSITSKITLDLKRFTKKQALINVDFEKKSRTGETNTFRTESFKRTNQLHLNTWIRLLTYIENERGGQKRAPLGLSILGSRAKSKSKQEKELWIKLVHKDGL